MAFYLFSYNKSYIFLPNQLYNIINYNKLYDYLIFIWEVYVMNYNVAVVGATGMVGRKFIEILESRNFPIENIYFLLLKDLQVKP